MNSWPRPHAAFKFNRSYLYSWEKSCKRLDFNLITWLIQNMQKKKKLAKKNLIFVEHGEQTVS